jgi:hypothetical protein
MRLLLVYFLLFTQSWALGQSCCSGSAPFANNINFGSVNQGMVIGLNYDYNNRNDFFSKRSSIEPHDYIRYSHASFLYVQSSIFEKFTIGVTVPYISHYRSSAFGNQSNELRSSGIGDPVVLLSYAVLTLSKNYLNLGIGVGLPIGVNDVKDAEFDLLLPIDLQPSINSWTYLFSANYQRQGLLLPNIYLFSNLIFLTQSNGRRSGSDQTFRYGNEYQFYSGLGVNLLGKKAILSPQISVRLKMSSFDKLNNVNVESSGGFWSYLGVGTQLVFQKFTFFSLWEMPIYRSINGAQLTTSYRLRAGISLRFKYSKSNNYETL